MRLWRFLSVELATVACLAAASMAAQEKKGALTMSSEAKATSEMRQRISSPSRAHKQLNVFAGVWSTKMSLWMDPSRPPVSSEGSSEQSWVLDGRFLQQAYRGQFMGQPFHGLGYIGYDNYRKRYISTWMDAAGTAIHAREGAFDDAGKVLTLTGKIDDYVHGKSIAVRERMVVVSPAEFIFEQWEPGPDGKDYKVMEVRYTRASTPARQSVEKLVARIQMADYEGDRKALVSLAGEMTPYTDTAALASRALYWRGFAKWRRALNGFNETVDPKELEKDLTEAVEDFTAAISKDPEFVDARIAASSCLFSLSFLSRNDTERQKGYVSLGVRLFGEASKASSDNPRLLWVQGAGEFFLPAERGGSQAKALETYKRGLEAARKQKNIVNDPLEPSWGEPELLMSLAWSYLNGKVTDTDAAESNARAALDLVPNWHYVRDILLPQIRVKAARPTPAPKAGEPAQTQASPTDFDFLEGQWAVVYNNSQPGVPANVPGTWIVRKQADGRVLYDEFRLAGPNGETVFLGATYRVFDSVRQQWDMRYVGLLAPGPDGVARNTSQWADLSAWREGSTIRVNQQGAQAFLRITYYDIARDRFRWKADVSTDGGKTWESDQIRIEARRAAELGRETP